jgi:hypothetical protein
MREHDETVPHPEPVRPLADRVHAAADGLAPLLAQAEAVQRERAEAAKRRGAPRWTDVITTQFTEFSNRPR